ncbi:MAG: amidohydrolase family protein [Anaerolineae bacterium]|nr:amidohydrolase family protein [Anaerolineae bacterium]
MRIDAHIHYMPPSQRARLADFIKQEPYWGLLLSPDEAGKSVQGWASAERMIEDMDRAGLDRVVMQGEYPQRHETGVDRNSRVLALIRQWPERVMAFAAIQPKAGSAALDELQRCLDGGMCGVGELNPYAQGFSLDDADFLRLVEACIDNAIPLNLHVSEEVGHYYPGKSTTPLRHYYRLAERYPELKLILAHWGGGLIFYELMAKVRRTLKNVWYDTAASPLLYPTKKIFPVALACLDHRKILYGSDYPLLLYPRRQPEPDFQPFLAQIGELALDDAIYEDIMGRNMARLLGIDKEINIEEEKASVQRSRPIIEKEIQGFMAVRLVVEAWPETQAVFDRFGIPWRDCPVPAWEPITQAAAAQGLGIDKQKSLIKALNSAIQ